MNGIDFDELERRIEEAAAKLGALREENGELRHQVEELEARLSRVENGDPADWQRERGEVRRRVAALVERLEGLLTE